MAAPFVTGAAGLIVSEYPQIDNARLKARLTNSVDRLENLEGKVKSGGRLNVARALERDDIAPAVRSKLESLYPDDKATGYTVGEIRGAMTIRKPL